MIKLKKVPKFKDEDEEFEFWSTHDLTKYVDFSKAEKVAFPNLKPTTKLMSIRLPISLLERLKLLAHQRDVPYQSLMKVLLSRAIQQEVHIAR